MIKYIFCLFFFIGIINWGYTQPTKTYTISNLNDSLAIELDATIIYATENKTLDIPSFIRYIQNDTTFYKAFKNLHFTTYNADNNIVIYDKKNVAIASLTSETKHIYRNNCRHMLILEEAIKGNFYNKKGDYEHYTSELYASVFFTPEPVCGEKNILDKSYLNPKGNAIEKNKAQLKQLMFNPGSKISGIPMMGNKAAIFDPSISSYYNFSLKAVKFNNEDCYLFEAIPKSGMEKKVVYQLFKTWFRISDWSIIARDYNVQYDAGIYDFNVKIKVTLTDKNNLLVPKSISYQGNWKVVGKDRERASFQTIFYH